MEADLVAVQHAEIDYHLDSPLLIVDHSKWCHRSRNYAEVASQTIGTAERKSSGIEMPGKRFMLGVQWHPEFFLADGNPNFALFEALVETAGRAK